MNRLASETSPYLLQHKDNPVHWRAWGTDAFETAKAENKPILLSVGYAACHWCHVMAHESFEDDETAAVMNGGFVNVKVDREERPDVDAIYQAALALIGEQGGWPLTMFLTPEGAPFWGGTYFPPEARFGRPGFRDLLAKVLEVYHGAPDRVAQNAEQLKSALQRLSHPRAGGPVPPDFLERAAAALVSAVDPAFGGIGQAPKFPQPALLELLWRGFKRTRNPAMSHAVMLTLERISQGGIYDHLGGGFARYSTDGEWLVPHFEKMLYDNAQLVSLMTMAWPENKSPLLAARIAETADWALREMRVPGGGFASSYDADSEGVEGKFYVWSESEVDEFLGADAGFFKSAYDVTAAGNWEDANILRRRTDYGDDPGAEEKLARCRAILWQARETRVKPGWDDKVLADWNGLMIAALAEAGAAFERPDWLEAARAAFAFVTENLGDGERLRHSWRKDEARHPATLDDYAAMAKGALALFEATGETSYIDRAERWVAVADKHFRDESGGYFLTADDTAGLITRTKTATDGALPSGNGTMAAVLARLYHLTAKDVYRERAAATIAAFSGEIAAGFYSFPVLLAADDLLANAVEIVVLGERGAADMNTLIRAVNSRSLPNRVIRIASPGADLPPGHPAHGRQPLDGKATAFVCRRQTCSLPVTEAEALSSLLDSTPEAA
jgi:uncharacterized protein YyaL (SSP411 family)